jgi:hypothetical protein
MAVVTINVEGRDITASREFLRRIDYFQRLLNSGMLEAQQNRIVLPDDSYDLVNHLFHFTKVSTTDPAAAAKFVASLSFERVCGLLALSKKLVYLELQAVCEDQFVRRLNDATIAMAMEYCTRQPDFNLQRTQCQTFIETCYAGEVFKKALFLQETVQGLSAEVMQMIIRDMRLPIEQLCDLIIRWIFANPLAENCTIVSHLDPLKLHYLQVMLTPPKVPVLSV